MVWFAEFFSLKHVQLFTIRIIIYNYWDFSELDAPVWIDITHCTRSRECFSTECIDLPKSPLNCANHSSDTSISCGELS